MLYHTIDRDREKGVVVAVAFFDLFSAKTEKWEKNWESCT